MNAAVLAAPAVPVVAAESPDADLVRLCTEGVALATERDSVKATASDDDYAAIIARLDQMAPVIGALVPATDAGLQAKAAFVLRYAEDEVEGLDGHAESEALRDLLRDALRPRSVAPVAPALTTAIGPIAAEVYRLWAESDTFDVGTPARDEIGEEAADREMNKRQRKALRTMQQALCHPAATLGDAAALLDFAISDVHDLEVFCEGDRKHSDAVRRVHRALYSAGRVVAHAAGLSPDPALNRSETGARRLFPRMPMPELRSAVVPEPTLVRSPLATIADRLEALEEQLGRIDAADTATDAEMMPPLREWWTTAEVVPDLAITTAADLLVLARICRVTWKRSQGDDCDLREQLDQKLHEAVIALAGRSCLDTDPDAALIADCAAFDALERQSLATFDGTAETPADDEAVERIREQLRKQQEPLFDQIFAARAVTLAGLRAKVRSMTLENLEIMKPGPGDWTDCFITSICRDILAGAVS